MYVAIACRIMTCSISKGFVTYHGSMECEINYNYKLCYMHKGSGNVHPRTGHKDLEGE